MSNLVAPAGSTLARQIQGRSPPTLASDVARLLVDGGREYAGWTDLRVTRGLDRCSSDFEVSCAERWLGQDTDWQLVPFTPVQVLLGNTVVLTGFVDAYDPQIDGRAHSVRVTGRSKTAQLVDCSPDIASGQFKGYALGAIARSICGLFGINVAIDSSAADACAESVADATIERAETAWTFLERLCRLSAVLACDMPDGSLLLTRTGTTRASTDLVEGGNIVSGRGNLNSHHRFSNYIVKGQAGVCAGAGGAAPDPYAGLAPANGLKALPTPLPAKGTGQVQTAQRAEAIDAGVPLYRPHVTIAESQLNAAQMQLRADWQRSYAYGRSIQPQIVVAGWRQSNGDLWSLNQIVSVQAPYFGVDQDLLVARVEYRQGERGTTTEMLLGPPEGWTPDPGEVRVRKHRKGRSKKGRAMLDTDGLPAAGPT